MTFGQEALRAELRAWLEDLEALRPFLDDENNEIAAAWRVAMVRAKEAATAYAAEMAPPGDGT